LYPLDKIKKQVEDLNLQNDIFFYSLYNDIIDNLINFDIS